MLIRSSTSWLRTSPDFPRPASTTASTKFSPAKTRTSGADWLTPASRQKCVACRAGQGSRAIRRVRTAPAHQGTGLLPKSMGAAGVTTDDELEPQLDSGHKRAVVEDPRLLSHLGDHGREDRARAFIGAPEPGTFG